MPSQTPAAKFIEETVNHPEWLKTIESGQADAVVALAAEHGFVCSLDELKQAAHELVPDQQVDEAAAGLSDFENDAGYGNDTGYAALYGVAGALLKL